MTLPFSAPPSSVKSRTVSALHAISTAVDDISPPCAQYQILPRGWLGFVLAAAKGYRQIPHHPKPKVLKTLGAGLFPPAALPRSVTTQTTAPAREGTFRE
jgi:hypothetical protein